jgi:hypothetical protein
MYRPIHAFAICEGLELKFSRDSFCPALATRLESRTVRRTVRRIRHRTVRSTVRTHRSQVRRGPTTDHQRTIDGHRTQFRTVRRTVLPSKQGINCTDMICFHQKLTGFYKSTDDYCFSSYRYCNNCDGSISQCGN